MALKDRQGWAREGILQGSETRGHGCVCVHTGEVLVARYTLQSTFPELGEPGQLHISGQHRDRGAEETP